MFSQPRREVMLSVVRERLHRAVREGDIGIVRKMLTNYKDWFNDGASDDQTMRFEDKDTQFERLGLATTQTDNDTADVDISDQSTHDATVQWVGSPPQSPGNYHSIHITCIL